MVTQMQAKNLATTISNSNVLVSNNNTVAHTVTAPPSSPLITFNTGSYPTLLHSLNLAFDSTFIASYSYYVLLEGLNIYQNGYLVPVSSTYEYVPSGKSYLIPAGSTLKVYAYMSGSTTTDGHISVTAVFDVIEPDPVVPDNTNNDVSQVESNKYGRAVTGVN
jgi:hypothetical protein